MPLNPPEHQFGELTPYGDPSWYRTYNRRVTLRSCRALWRSSRLHSPYYNASHRAFRERVRAFVDAEVTPFCDQWDRRVRARRSETQLTDGELCRAKAIPRELFAKAFAAGLLPGVVGPPWPVAYAGPGPEARGG